LLSEPGHRESIVPSPEDAAGSAFLEPGMEMVTKPFRMDVLASKIREMIEGSAASK
jgi:hypothetical protein